MTENSENLPVNWQEQMAAEAQQVARAERPQVSKISMRSGVLSIDDKPLADNEMVCVIVGALHEQVDYDRKPWKPDEQVPPICYALHAEPAAKGHMAPDENVPEPQDDICQTCPRRQFSDNGDKPSCQGRRRIAVVAYNPKTDELDDQVYTMSFPQYSSGKEFSSYANRVAIAENRPPYGVVTQAKLAPHPKWQHLLGFEAVKPVPDEVMGQVMQKVEEAESMLAMPYDMEAPSQAEPASVKGTE